jgi:hypothetical protein
MDVDVGLCNGTKMRILQINSISLKCEVIARKNGQIHFLSFELN